MYITIHITFWLFPKIKWWDSWKEELSYASENHLLRGVWGESIDNQPRISLTFKILTLYSFILKWKLCPDKSTAKSGLCLHFMMEIAACFCKYLKLVVNLDPYISSSSPSAAFTVRYWVISTAPIVIEAKKECSKKINNWHFQVEKDSRFVNSLIWQVRKLSSKGAQSDPSSCSYSVTELKQLYIYYGAH